MFGGGARQAPSSSRASSTAAAPPAAPPAARPAPAAPAPAAPAQSSGGGFGSMMMQGAALGAGAAVGSSMVHGAMNMISGSAKGEHSQTPTEGGHVSQPQQTYQ